MKTVSRQTARDDRHDAAVMESHEHMRRDGLKPAPRVVIDMEAAALGCTGGNFSNWNARSDAISAAPDKVRS